MFAAGKAQKYSQQLWLRHLLSAEAHLIFNQRYLSDLHSVAGKAGHASSQGAAFYAEDFTSDISVRTVRGHRNGTNHRHRYTKPGDAKHNRHDNEWHNEWHDRYAARNDLNPDRDDLNHRLRFDGYAANVAARKHHHG
jgi:hypothetical protein